MLIDKNSLPLVSQEFMNDVHYEDVDIINSLHELILKYEKEPISENAELINNKYQEWTQHTINHFKGEEDKMLELRFPPYPMHKGEHENALAQMDYVYNQWNGSKDINILKDYICNTLPQWLTHHIQTMDTVTAMFFTTGLSPCGGGH